MLGSGVKELGSILLHPFTSILTRIEVKFCVVLTTQCLRALLGLNCRRILADHKTDENSHSDNKPPRSESRIQRHKDQTVLCWI